MKVFNLIVSIIASTIIISCSGQRNSVSNTKTIESIKFKIDLNDRSNDTFKITVLVPKLSEENSIFQFAATAPGTYSVMDIGRFVTSFIAYDKNGNIVETKKITTNQYEFSEPKKVHSIQYKISETFDTKVDKNQIYPMCGTSIEDNHTFINPHAVLGYIKGKQGIPINIQIEYPDTWVVGTALELNADKSYTANNYDHAVDSPILLGELTTATLNVSGTNVEIFTYSEKGIVSSEMILESLKDMLVSADLFLEGLPVNKYTFLFHFETNDKRMNGAWEHSYSSAYANQELPWNQIANGIKDMASHEFFHIVTPLNIHSEIIQEFNFIEPIASRHLWLYEGTTEWAAHMMLFRAGQKSLDDYLNMLRRKVHFSQNYYKSDYSLLDLSLNCFTEKGQKEYGDIYMRGALIAGLLDIRLLEISNGQTSLSDVINSLAKKYGPNKPFIDATFIEEFVDFTYPEISEFMDLYIKQINPLPFEEYYQKIGIIYSPKELTFSIDQNATKEQILLRNAWMEQLN